MKTKIISLFAMLFAVLLLGGCAASRQVNYFQDIDFDNAYTPEKVADIHVRSGDKLSIIIKSKNADLSDLFNLSTGTHRVGYSQASSLNQSQYVSLYTVNSSGMIDFPVLGELSIAGKNREQIADIVKQKLIDSELVLDPVVTVEFANLFVTVLGEVNKPGRYDIDRDKITILDALGMAGDLTIYGNRNKVIVLRDKDDKQVPYRIDLTSLNELYASPAFYLRQNDIIYVEPNNTRARQSTVNGNTIRSSSFWISVGSLLTSLLILFVR